MAACERTEVEKRPRISGGVREISNGREGLVGNRTEEWME